MRVSIETAEPSSGASQRNSPTLHVWLRILDLGPPPTAHGVVVACLMADGEGRPVEVARTPLSSRLDPFFDAPLALRGAASGKGSGRPLTFAVLALSGAGEEALVAEAHIASDKLRDCGRLQGLTPGTRLSGVVALPLCAPGDAQQPLPKAALHCLVLAGPSGGGAAGARPGAAQRAAARRPARRRRPPPPPPRRRRAPPAGRPRSRSTTLSPAAPPAAAAAATRWRCASAGATSRRRRCASTPRRSRCRGGGGSSSRRRRCAARRCRPAASSTRPSSRAAAPAPPPVAACDAEARVTYSLDAPAVEAAEASSAAAPPPPKPPAATRRWAPRSRSRSSAPAPTWWRRGRCASSRPSAAPLAARVRRADPAAPSVGQLVELAVDLASAQARASTRRGRPPPPPTPRPAAAARRSSSRCTRRRATGRLWARTASESRCRRRREGAAAAAASGSWRRSSGNSCRCAPAG